MRTELLTLTPEEFCDATGAFAPLREFAKRYASMAEVWDECIIPDWLLWILGRIEAEGLPVFAEWCAERAARSAARADLAADRARAAAAEAVRATDARAAADAYVRAADARVAVAADAYAVRTAQVAEIRRRWGNPFKS